MKTFHKIPTKDMGRVPLQQFHDVQESEVEKLYGQFYQESQETWKIAMSYETSQLDKTIQRYEPPGGREQMRTVSQEEG